MPSAPPVPCPVRLGSVRSGGAPALLHSATLERNLRRMEKLLKKGVDVDCENSLGQTPLFCASLLGFSNVVELLLQYGADPNHRCVDRSTPVHAAVFSCNPWLLSGLLDAGGDLRLHDDQGRTPRDWAEAGAQEHSPRMLDFLKRCVSHMWSLTQTHSPRDGRSNPTSSKTLLRSPSLLELLRPGGSDLFVNKKPSLKSSVCDVVQCFGYGKLCIEKSRRPAGVLASVPLIADCELVQAEDEALYSFTCGSHCCMTNYSWRGCRVTVKELETHTSQKHAEQDGFQDLLISELEFCSRLFHPHLLQLMAVSIVADLQQSRLVYERVHMGSLYTILYHRRAEFPMLQVCELLAVVLQVCEALLYLHGQALVLRALSSHSVIIVHPGVAKVTGLGFIVPSEGSCPGNVSPLPLPAALYNWAAPEVIRRRECTGKADLYSLCALIQELYTDAVPWRCVDPYWIKQAVDTGQALSPDAAVPQPYYQLLQSGLQPQPKDRTCSLQDLRFTLRCDLKEFSKRKSRSGVCPLSVGLSMPRWSSELRQDRKPEEAAGQQSAETDSMVDQEIQDQLLQLDQLLENETVQKKRLPTFPRRLQDSESSLDTKELCRDISCPDVLPLDEWRLTLCTPVAKTSSSQDLWSSSSTLEDELATPAPSAVSEYISSIVLNLKVSQVLLQQVESSLENAELRLTNKPTYNQLGAGVSEDEVDGLSQKNKGKVVVLKAVGPPSTYRPLLQLQEGGWSAVGQHEWGINIDEEISHYCSAVEETFLSLEGERNVGSRAGGRQQQPVRIAEPADSSYLSSDGQVTTPKSTAQARPNWTSEVSEAVAQMTRGRLGTPAGPVCSSDSEDVEEQLRLLVDRQSPHRHTELEQLVKSFAAVQSESEESAEFLTVNPTFTMQESTEPEKESSSESDCRDSPVEPSSMFYTPKHHSANTHTTEELSETLSSEEDPNITMEVCRPNAAVTDGQAVEASVRECQSAPERLDQTESSTSAMRAPHAPSQVQDFRQADIADLSSITCSPAELQEWAGQDGAPPSPHSTRFPPCNSTPRSPGTHTGPDRSPAPRAWESVPLLRTLLLDTSPWDSVPERSVCTETYATASLGTCSTTEPSQMDISLEETDTPTTGNQDFTTASSGTKHTPTETSSQGAERRAAPGRTGTSFTTPAGPEKAEAVCEEEEEIDEERGSCVSEHSGSISTDRSPDQPPASCLVGVSEEEEDDVEDKECEEQSNAEEQKEEEENAPEKGLICAVLDGAAAAQRAETGRSTTAPESSEETERAHSTLDEDLQRLLVAQMEGQRAFTELQPVSEAKTALCEAEEDVQVRDECICPAGDGAEGAVRKGVEASDELSSGNMNDQGQKAGAEGHITWNQTHRVIVLEHSH
ncbi:inactive serine/threonine-protein kinase TEX14 [Salminus brasiliensis]|uniref:inactive serine/threonine-protein kinase TEX14 n=1 Tax=Salminus brasiliensis TaxID=930266 RepID=UPI003B838953